MILWVFPLIVMAACGFYLLLLRGRPKCIRSNAHQLSALGLAGASLFGLVRHAMPAPEVVVMAWCAATLVALRLHRELVNPEKVQ